ncbi:hypothetical protein AgCh_027176 [Apium graveolens]
MDENRVLDIFDSQVTKESRMVELMAFANIAYRCLNFNARNRPTMKEVVADLESIRNTNGSPFSQQHYEEVEYGKHELNETWESDITSTSGTVETTKLFTTKELEKATDRYSVDRIMGEGG